jgi:hypothetical protein
LVKLGGMSLMSFTRMEAVPVPFNPPPSIATT